MKIKGWNLLFHPLFAQQHQQLLDRVRYLQTIKPTSEYVKHPQVKLFKAVTVAIEEKIPEDPLAPYFVLKKPLNKYCRVKKMGLPQRYRLFFRVFAEQKTIIILWLGFPRKTGDKKDCYRVFAKMVERGEFPHSTDELQS